MPDTYSIALQYHSLGRCVIPSGGGEKHKKALIPWTKYQTERPTEQEIKDWQKKYSPKVWAMPTGPVSECFVIDCDSQKAAELLTSSNLKPHVKTPRGGCHFYFKYPAWPVPTKAGILPEIDVRGAGGYVNFCGNIGGGSYEVLRLPSQENLIELCFLPNELFVVLKPEETPPKAVKKSTAAKKNTSSADKLAERILNEAVNKASPGTRNDTGFWLACQLRDNQDNGITPIDAESIMREYASRVSHLGPEVYTEKEALASYKEAMNRPAREPWHTGPASSPVKLPDTPAAATAGDEADNLRELSDGKYFVKNNVIYWNKPTRDAHHDETALCNFNARVIEDIIKDNGLETARFYKIIGQRCSGDMLPSVTIPDSSFDSMHWVRNAWGMRTNIEAGQNIKDHLRHAIELRSHKATIKTVYTHTGWREINGKMAYLSASGAIGAENVEVELPPQLARYSLPSPENDPIKAIAASWAFLDIGILRVTLPLLAAAYLAPLSEILEPAFTLWYVGSSGTFKSTVTSLALSHFGDFDEGHTPAAWRDTMTELEYLCFIAKDVPLLIDDWAPGQDSSQQRILESKAEYVIRGQANRQGRGRMRPDLTSRPSYIPRGVLITSGEQLPSGHSHTARIFTVQIERENINTLMLTRSQKEKNLYKLAMAHYIAWIKDRLPELKKSLPEQWEKWRDEAKVENQHLRLPGAVAWLYTGLNMFLTFALEKGAIKVSEAEIKRTEGWKILTDIAAEQGVRIERERAGVRFLEGLKAILSTKTGVLGDKEDIGPRELKQGQTQIGWVDSANGHVLLNPPVVFQLVCKFYQYNGGESFTIKRDAVWQDLKRLGYIEAGKNGDPTICLWVAGSTKRVLKVSTKLLESEDSEAEE